MLAFVLAIGASRQSLAADCAANATPASDCSNLSLAQQYIDANIGASVTVTSTGAANKPAVKITADQNGFTNAGTLRGESTGAQGLYIGPTAGTVTITTLSNSGTIQGYSDSVGVLLKPGATVTSFDNSGQIAGGSNNGGLKNFGGTITTLTNQASGSITSTSAAGVYNATDVTNGVATGGTIGTLINYGTISGATYGINNGAASDVLSTIGTISNFGTLSGNTAGIGNSGTISTLNNAQGTASASALTFKGTLPTNYNIIINSTSSYGQLSGVGVSGSMNFGIYPGSTLAMTTYSAVLSGVSAANLGTASGTYQSLPWVLRSRAGTIWDLVVGLSADNTQASIETSASAIRSLLVIKGSALANNMQYDCAIAPAQNACVAVTGRHVSVIGGDATDIGGAFVISVRLSDSVRIGLSSDQSLGGRIGDGSLRTGGRNSLVGSFIDWKPDRRGGGIAVKLAAGYESTPMSISRRAASYSEPGAGETRLQSHGLQLTARYGINAGGRWQLTPYAGWRQLRQGMDAYEESSSSSVTMPLAYNALSADSRMALAGFDLDFAVHDFLHLVAAGGFEASLNDGDVSYVASNMGGLTPVRIGASPARRRLNAMLGAYYRLSPFSRLELNGIYREEAWEGLRTARMQATYTAGF